MKTPHLFESFRFRFISRGEDAGQLTRLAVRALQWCHPGVRISVVDGNDERQLRPSEFPGAEVVHLVPGDDAVAAQVGRGSRKHLFYWRHSPQVLAAIPPDTEFATYMDSDILLMRPMDLASLAAPLRRGRIGVAVDESMLAYTGFLQEHAHALSSVLSVPGASGPLLQGGLIFTRAADHEDLYRELWSLAATAARESALNLLPFDDMALLTALLTQGGKLWERCLLLGPEWNYITAAGQDPGVFVVGAHYGGFRAKAQLLQDASRFTAPESLWDAWGSTFSEFAGGRRHFVRGIIPGAAEGAVVKHVLPPPFAISWKTPPLERVLTIEIQTACGTLGNILIYIDGVFHFRYDARGLSQIRGDIDLSGSHVITVIAAPHPEAGTATVEILRRAA